MQNAHQQEMAIFQQLPAIVKAYQMPSTKMATIQVLNSFLPFLGIWIAMYFLYQVSIPLTLLLAVVNAFFLVRIFIIQHDCGHQSFTGSRQANDWIGRTCALFSLIPYKYWAKSHNFHHGHNGILWEHRDIGDIQTLTVEEFRELSWFKRVQYILFRNPVVMFIIGPIFYIFVTVRLPFIRLKAFDKARRALIRSNIRIILFHAALIFFLGYKVILFVHLPIIWAFGIIAIWFFYIQHQHETTYKEWKDRWEYLKAAIQGSSYYKLPKLMHWLTGNIGYHHIHHLNAQVPNYNLARCQQENPILKNVANTLTFRESLKCVFHNLWDEEQQRMISFREYYRRSKSQNAAN
ncbi:MAG: fatty acid desaturase [Lewinellaceae bacterium]|nr:fatty acid desaturase [Lewinella sp.]MCB9280469.1 fatty acid desaturase [Lewinellaceae bacterium]